MGRLSGIFRKSSSSVNRTDNFQAIKLAALLDGVDVVKAYQENPYAYRCVDLRASSVASVTPRLYAKDGAEIDDPKHPLYHALTKPNPHSSWRDLIYNVQTDVAVHGNAYVYLVKTVNGLTGMYHLPAADVTFIQDTADVLGPGVTEWRYTGRGQQLVIKPENMIHIKTYSGSEILGMSPLKVAARAILQQRLAREWNNSFMKNGAQPSGVIEVPYEMDEEMYSDFAGKVQSNYTGSSNSGKMLVLDNGKKFQSNGMTAVEMDFTNSLMTSAREIAIALKVPPELVGDSSNKTYSNAMEANKEFASHTLVPLLDQLYDALSRRIAPLYSNVERIGYDMGELESLRGDKAALMTAVGTAWYMTINERREMLGLGALDEDGDTILIPMGNIPLSDAVEPLPPIPGMEDEDART